MFNYWHRNLTKIIKIFKQMRKIKNKEVQK